MSSYGRDQMWDPGTWAEIDEAVSEVARGVRVARRIFPTENVAAADGSGPNWIAAASSRTEGSVLEIPEGPGDPMLEVSVRFRLTPAQADAERTLHTARTLARAAARDLALAEDRLFFRGTDGDPLAGVPTAQLMSAAEVGGKHGVATEPIAVQAYAPPANSRDRRPDALLTVVTDGLTRLISAGRPGPFALILGQDLYADAHSRLFPASSSETPADRLQRRVQHLLASAALQSEQGVLVSLAGEPAVIYVARDACTAFLGFTQGAAVHASFRVFSRFTYAIREPSSILRLE